MPEIAKLTAVIELDDRKFQAAVKQDAQALAAVAGVAGDAGEKIEALGASTDTAAAATVKATAAVKAEATSLSLVKREAHEATAAHRALGEGEKQAAAGAMLADKALREEAAGAKTATAGAQAATAAHQRLETSLQDAGREARRTGDSAESLGAKLKKIDTSRLEGAGRNLSIGVTAPLLAMAGAAVKASSDLTESLGKNQIVFGSHAKAVEQWASTSRDSLGLTKQAAVESAATFGNLFVSMDMDAGKAAGMSKGLVQLAADLGALNNATTQEGVEALRSGLVGETEPLRRFGINLNDAAIRDEALRMGLIKTTKEALEPAAKAQAVYSLAMQQAGTAHGNFLATNKDLAGSLKITKAEVGDLAAEFGKELEPAAKTGLTVVRDLLKAFNSWPDSMKQTTLQVGLLAAALGPVLTTVGLVVRGLAGVWGVGSKMLGMGGAAGAVGLPIPASAPAAGAATSTAVATGGRAAMGGLLNPVTGAIVAGVGAGYGLAAWQDKRQGKQDVGIGGTLYGLGLNPWYKPPNADSVISAEEHAQMRAAKAAEKQGAKQAAKQAKVQDAEKVAAASDAEFAAKQAELGSKLAGGPEETAARRESAAMVPLLRARMEALAQQAKDLEPSIKADAEAAKEYWSLRREGAQLQEQVTGLQSKAAQEAADATKKAGEAAKKDLEERRKLEQDVFQGQLQVAKVQAGRAAEELQAQALLRAELPLLTQRQQQLEQEAAVLLPEARQGGEAAKRYHELHAEFWSLEERRQQRQEAARSEVERNRKAAETAAKKNADQAKRQAEDFARFQTDVARSYQDAASKAERAFQQANSERLGLASGRTGLAEAQLKNNPFLNDRQKQQALTPLLIEQFRELMRPVQGEGKLDSLRRLTEAEGLKGQIVGGLGLQGRRAALAYGQLNELGAEAARSPFQSQALAQAQQAAEQARKLAPAPVVQQFIIQGPMTMQKLWEAFQRFQQQQNSAAGMIGAVG